MLDVVSDPSVNLHFNSLKGSVSPYTKPTSEALDTCSSQVYEILSDKEAVLPPYASYGDAGTMHRLDAEIYNLWKKSQTNA